MPKTIDQLQDSGGIDVDNDLFLIRRSTSTQVDLKATFADIADAVKASASSSIQYDVTIASGVISVDTFQSPIAAYHLIDTEGAVAADDLNSIIGTKQGQILTLQLKDASRTVTVKDGVGNIFLTSGDFTLDNTRDAIQLVYRLDIDGWCEVRRANNP